MKRLYAVMLAGVVSASVSANPAPQPHPNKDPLCVEAFAPENDGSCWAMRSNGELLCIAGGNIHPLKGPSPKGICYFRQFLGDPSRGYYFQRHDSNKHQKLIYRLIDGEARLYCQPLVAEPHSEELLVNTYVARDGRIVSWNTGRIALWQHNAWSLHPALVARDEGLPVFLEHDGHIIVVCGILIHVISPDGKLTTYRPGWDAPTFHCVHWKDRIALRTTRGVPSPHAFDLLNGEPLPPPSPFAEIREPVATLTASSGGNVWAKTTCAMYRLGPKDPFRRLELPATANLELKAVIDRKHTGMPEKTEPSWDILFTDGNGALLWWNASGLERWDGQHGITRIVRNFSYTDDHTAWFLSGGVDARIFSLPLNEPVASAAEEKPDRWQTHKVFPGSHLMEMDGMIAFLDESGHHLRRWDGKVFTEQALPSETTNGVLSGVAWDNQGHVYLQHVYRKAPFTSLIDMGPNIVTVLADAFTHYSQSTMESVLVRAVNRGATAFDHQGWEVVPTPEKKIWLLDRNSGALRLYDGLAWREVRIESTVSSLAYLPHEGVIIQTEDNRTLVYNAGMFEERKGCAPTLRSPAPPSLSPDSTGTPLAGRVISARYTDRKGNLWFWLGMEATASCYRVDDLRLTAQGLEDSSCPDRLAIRATLTPPLDNIRYEARLNGSGDWQPLQTQRGVPARLRFPSSGIYTCEVSSVFLGMRLPQTAVFPHKARVALPDTQLTLPENASDPLPVSRYDWRPPVVPKPTSFMRNAACRLIWRLADSEAPWRPLEKEGRFPLHQLGTNGVYRLVFAAQEEDFWQDTSPVELTVRLALDDEGQLLVTLDQLVSEDPGLQDTARRRLRENQQRWRPLLEQLLRRTKEAQATLMSLDSVLHSLQQHEEKDVIDW